MPTNKNAQLNNNFLISQFKHMVSDSKEPFEDPNNTV